MSNHLIYEKTLIINATSQFVWEVLTKSEYTKQYMFNCEVFSDWTTGSDITWKGNYMGYEAFQKGNIIECIPMQYVKYSTFDPNFGYEDNPDNYVHVSYKITPTNNKMDLTIISDNFQGDEKRYLDTAKGWDEIVIPALMKIFE